MRKALRLGTFLALPALYVACDGPRHSLGGPHLPNDEGGDGGTDAGAGGTVGIGGTSGQGGSTASGGAAGSAGSAGSEAGEGGANDGTIRVAAFRMIEPVQRHIDEARNATDRSLRTRVAFVSDDLSFVIGSSESWRTGAEVPNGEPIRWTPSGGTMELGALPGVDSATDQTSVSDIDASGSVVVGSTTNAGGGKRAFRWTEATGMADISPEGSAEAYADLVSEDGSVVAGWFSGIENGEMRVFRWTSDTGAVDLGAIPGGVVGTPSFLSADGSVIAGVAAPECLMLGTCEQQNVLFEWSEEAGMQNLGTLSDYDYCYATFPTEVSYGPLMTGYCGGTAGFEPFIWSEADGLRGLGELPAGGEGGPSAVSEDGRVALFQGRTAAGTAVAWRWTADSGVTEIPPTAGYDALQIFGFRWSMSADGSVAKGTLEGASGTRAVRLTSRGLDLLPLPDGHDTSSPLGISRDGKTIAGSSTPLSGDGLFAVVWRGDDVVLVSDALAAAGIDPGDGVTLLYASPFLDNVLVGDARTERGNLAWIAELSD